MNRFTAEDIMDEVDDLNESVYNEIHERTIIHIDIDCFYAQVEMLDNPELREKPFGVQQKNIVVTCNYAARAAGVKKTCWIRDALKICPNLILINGEDLHKYRKISQSIFTILQSMNCPVEKLGMDENFIDVTDIVYEKLRCIDSSDKFSLVGHSFKSMNGNNCSCGCSLRLKLASQLAQDLREKLVKELNITSSAGISYNKLLSKLIGSCHKPNDQTILFPCDALEYMSTLTNVKSIPGIGSKMFQALKSNNIESILDLQNCNISKLETFLDKGTAQKIRDLSFGIDNAPVKQTGQPLSIGLEDRFKMISTKEECLVKLKWLLQRLCILIHEDGRLPQVLKVTVRDYFKDKEIKKFHKESRQCKVTSSYFKALNNSEILEKLSETKVLDVLMNLLLKMVDVRSPFHLTLIGISTTDFIDPSKQSKNAITNFFQNTGDRFHYSNVQSESGSKDPFKDKATQPKSIINNYFNSNSGVTMSSSSKIQSIDSNDNKTSTNSMQHIQHEDINLEILHELPKDIQEEILKQNKSFTSVTCPRTKQNLPPGWDEEVFLQLPPDIQKELLASNNSSLVSNSTSVCKKRKLSINDYFKH